MKHFATVRACLGLSTISAPRRVLSSSASRRPLLCVLGSHICLRDFILGIAILVGILLFLHRVESLAPGDTPGDAASAAILLLEVRCHPATQGAILVQWLYAPVRVKPLLLLRKLLRVFLLLDIILLLHIAVEVILGRCKLRSPRDTGAVGALSVR